MSKKNKKEKTKKEKKQQKKRNKKVRSNVVEVFPSMNEKVIDAITQSVKVNKAMLKRDAESQKAWKEEYFNGLFTEFKKFIKKYNEGLGFKEEQLIDKINTLKLKVKEYERKIKKLEEVNKILKDNA